MNHPISKRVSPNVNRPKPTTIKDIARVAGVSTATVSQALRPSETSNIKLQKDTIERVRLVANQLNYRPHVGARSIRSKHFGTIGYFPLKEGLLAHTPDGYLVGAHHVAEEHDCRITMIRMPHRVDEIGSSIPKAFMENNLDALIIESYNHIADKIYQQIKENRLPVIYLNDRHGKNSVYVDDVWAAAELTRYLISKGYQKICFLHRQIADGPTIEQMHHSAMDRKTGYEQSMKAAGLVPHTATTTSSSETGFGAELKDEDWNNIKAFDAVVTYDDDLANVVGSYCLKHSIQIPQELAIASFNGDYGAMSAWMRMTTMKIPSYEMGRAASRMTFELLGNRTQSLLESEVFRPTLMVGDTA